MDGWVSRHALGGTARTLHASARPGPSQAIHLLGVRVSRTPHKPDTYYDCARIGSGLGLGLGLGRRRGRGRVARYYYYYHHYYDYDYYHFYYYHVYCYHDYYYYH